MQGMIDVYHPYVLKCMYFQHECRSYSKIRTVMDYEFDLCVSCDREMQIDDTSYKIDKGCFVIRKPGQTVKSKGIFHCYMLTLDFSNRTWSSDYSRNSATKMQRVFESPIWDILPTVFHPVHYDDCVRIFEELLSVNEININENPKTYFLINELLHLLISDAFFRVESNKKIPVTPIDEICSYIKKHYMEEISLDDLAAAVHLNKNYLVRQFKKSIGISPISYLIQIRMDHAKKLLTETDLPVKSVAFHCGYKDPAFFGACFKKLFAATPVQYRLSQQCIDSGYQRKE